VKQLSLKAGLGPLTTERDKVEARIDLLMDELETNDRQWRLGSNTLAGTVQFSFTNQNLLSARFDGVWRQRQLAGCKRRISIS